MLKVTFFNQLGHRAAIINCPYKNMNDSAVTTEEAAELEVAVA